MGLGLRWLGLWLLDHVDGLPVGVGGLDNAAGSHHDGLLGLPVVGHAKVALWDLEGRSRLELDFLGRGWLGLLGSNLELGLVF